MQSAGTRRAASNTRSRFSLKRLALFAALGVIVLTAGYVITSTGTGASVREWGRERLVTLAANAGYRVNGILIEGRENTDPELIKSIVNLERGSPLFAFDPETTRDLLRKVSWIKDANVQRVLPDTVYIHLTERTPMALWQYQGKVRVIDAEGVALTNDLQPFMTLPFVVGDGANNKAADLLAMLAAVPEITSRLEAASWIGDRRWDLKLKSGMTIKLPEDDVGLALRKLADSQRNDGLLDRNVELVDLREGDRFVVRTKPGAVQDYKVNFKTGGGDI
jgi:cell division protein FtsQ